MPGRKIRHKLLYINVLLENQGYTFQAAHAQALCIATCTLPIHEARKGSGVGGGEGGEIGCGGANSHTGEVGNWSFGIEGVGAKEVAAAFRLHIRLWDVGFDRGNG